jgi:hypothetical protein
VYNIKQWVEVIGPKICIKEFVMKNIMRDRHDDKKRLAINPSIKPFLLGVLMVMLTFGVTMNVSAQDNASEPVKFVLNFTNFGIGTNLPYSNPTFGFEIDIELLNFGVEHKDSFLQATFSPFRIFIWPLDISSRYGDPGVVYFSFVNISASWNALGLLTGTEKLFVSPAFSYHWAMNSEFLPPSKHIFFIGLQGGITGETDKVKYNVFSLETGVRIIYDGLAWGTHFFAGIKFDLLMPLGMYKFFI